MGKNTQQDSTQMVESEITKMLEILKNGSTNEQKKKARKEVIRLEKHLRDKSYEELNGKKYPERLYHSGPEPMNKKEVLKLIDSVETPEQGVVGYMDQGLDLSGVSVGKNRFKFIELD